MNGTGPRTAVGKSRSKFNATKHGIFSNVILLPGESSAEFDALLDGLREHYNPVGALEEIKVDKLATQLWRYRRFLIAECAEIRKGIAYPGWNTNHPTNELVTIVLREDGHDDTLMDRNADPEIRENCLGLLRNLKSRIEIGGFDVARDSTILTKLYGESSRDNAKKTLFARYPTPLPTTIYSGQEREKDGTPLPEQSRGMFLEELETEIRRLEHNKQTESDRWNLEALRQQVPDSSLPERLLRYEANLERNIDRTMGQIEWLQGIRLGKPVSQP